MTPPYFFLRKKKWCVIWNFRDSDYYGDRKIKVFCLKNLFGLKTPQKKNFKYLNTLINNHKKTLRKN